MLLLPFRAGNNIYLEINLSCVRNYNSMLGWNRRSLADTKGDHGNSRYYHIICLV